MDQAKENRDQYIDLINTMEATDIKGNHSIKPTMFGLLPDKQTCSDYILDIMAAAAAHGNFVRIDMENSPTVDDTIAIFRRIKAEFPKNVGLVRQAYLKRTRSDIEAMLDLIEKYNIPKDRYEFQMLYGVTPKQRQSLADDGHKVRVYVPFGEHWFGYSTRRLKENPAMVTHIVTALFAKK
jgi:proline dehydrogenase